MSQDRRPIIIRRKKVVKGHHGGSWKIAFADFMTALMALFLVMWVLSSSSKEQKASVGEYFRTPLVTALAGGNKNAASSSAIPGGGADPIHAEGERIRIEIPVPVRADDSQKSLRRLRNQIKRVVENDPELRELSPQVRLEITNDGLRIQLVDTEHRPMFAVGSEQIAPYMRDLLRTIAPLLNELPNELEITGHTDSLAYAGGYHSYSNWELAVGRANASRRELAAAGFDQGKLLRVSGMADRMPLNPDNPMDPINRRITLTVLYEEAADSIRSPKLLKREGQAEHELPSVVEAVTAEVQGEISGAPEQTQSQD